MSKLKTEYVELADIKVAYHQYGSGPVLLLLHGNSGNKDHFKKYQLEHFKEYHTIAIDSRGHGETVSDDQCYTIDQFSDDVIKFCEQLGIEKAYAIGYSDGGNIGLFLSHKAPHIFEKVVAISPNYRVDGMTDAALRLLKSILGLFNFLRKLGFNTEKNIMRFQMMFEELGLSDVDLQSIQSEMKILYAQKDMIKEEHILQMGRLIPNALVKKIEKCNHLNILQKHQTIEQIKKFL